MGAWASPLSALAPGTTPFGIGTWHHPFRHEHLGVSPFGMGHLGVSPFGMGRLTSALSAWAPGRQPFRHGAAGTTPSISVAPSRSP
eukprot:1365115-Prymnesium_polylepis.1